MRLLHTSRFILEQFTEGQSRDRLVASERDVVPDYAIPAYAILSHTWEDEEVLFEDVQGDDMRGERFASTRKKGWHKITASCELACREGYDWIWIDTCCIDKTSSAELSEAINSMFRWYRMSAVCYVYLSDAVGTQPVSTMDSAYGPRYVPRWYSRGWTLQELIAPRQVRFYNAEWSFCGTREQHIASIAKTCGVDEYALNGGDLSRISVARRMTWLSKRETTRLEDIAYCVLGIFDVNMPLLYGEGPKAFLRLQEEIIRLTDDQSIFAWRDHDLVSSYREEYGDTFDRSGLLASTPRLFATSTIVAQYRRERPDRPHTTFTSKGVRINMLMCKDESYESGEVYQAALDCPVGHIPGVVAGIRLRRVSDVGDIFVRVDIAQLFQFARCRNDGISVDIAGFNPTVDQDELVCLRMRTKSRDWRPKTIYVTQAGLLQLPPPFWILPPPPYRDRGPITIHHVHPGDVWDENTWILQPPLTSSRSQTIGIFNIEFNRRRMCLLLGLFVTPTGIEPWCKIMEDRPVARMRIMFLVFRPIKGEYEENGLQSSGIDDLLERSLERLRIRETEFQGIDVVDNIDGSEVWGVAVVIERTIVSDRPVYIVHFQTL